MAAQQKDPLAAVRRDLTAAAARLTSEIEERNAALTRVRAALEALGQEPARPTKPPAGERASLPPENQETLDTVLHAIAAASFDPALPDVPGSFTRRQAAELVPLGPSTVSRAIVALRDQGLLRLAGRAATGGARPAEVYVLAGSEANGV